MTLAVDTTQWIIALGSLASALIALALGLGLRDWVFRPRGELVLRHRSDPDEISDRIVTKRLETGDSAAFARLRIVNRGRSTARNVTVRILKVHRWAEPSGEWIRARPELDGRSLQPSNHVASDPHLVDVFPFSDRILDLASVDLKRVHAGANPLLVEINRPWPPNEANVLAPATWRLELMVCGDNIKPKRAFVALSFDGTWPERDTHEIWQHFLIDGPFRNLPVPPEHHAGRRSQRPATSGVAP